MFTFALLILCSGWAVAFSNELSKVDSDIRYQYARDSKGHNHLVDMWITLDDIKLVPQYDPVASNEYHLFTRQNPSISQPLTLHNQILLEQSNFNKDRRTIVLIHSWMDSATSDFNSVLVPVFLAAEDLNVIVVDWSIGANSLNYRLVIANTIASGKAVAGFIDWLNQETGYSLVQYHIVGHGFGGHQAGIVGRNLRGEVTYITGLDPALIGWVNHIERFNPKDGIYTEVIHTNYGGYGYLADLARVDFYANGGISMPGCDSNACDHARSYFYFAESITSGGFIGRQCLNYYAAVLNSCDNLPGRLEMGDYGLSLAVAACSYWRQTPRHLSLKYK